MIQEIFQIVIHKFKNVEMILNAATFTILFALTYDRIDVDKIINFSYEFVRWATSLPKICLGCN